MVKDIYRLGVGGVILNKEKKILMAERIDYSGEWQMPQGGIERGEALEIAILRELKEELGTNNFKIIAQTQWLSYIFPEIVRKKLWNAKYVGQKQIWFFLDFLGEDNDINLIFHDKVEFKTWNWFSKEEVVHNITEFKKDLYRQIISFGEKNKII